MARMPGGRTEPGAIAGAFRQPFLFLVLAGLALLFAAIGLPLGGLSPGRKALACLALAGMALIVVAMLRGRLVRVYGTFALLMLNALLLLGFLEVGATFWNALAGTGPKTFEPPPPALAEVGKTGVIRSLYVGWLGRPYAGQDVSIGADGLRHTPALAPTPGGRPIRVFAFGGSTMWGEGAADGGTIPAHLQAMLTRQTGHPVAVTNFGQRAWVSTQSLVELILELQKGNRPDVVVFYDGYNDTFGAYATGMVGVPENFVTDYSSGGWGALRNMLVSTDLGQLLRRLVAPSPEAEQAGRPVTVTPEAIVGAYHKVFEMVGALGRHFGFANHFYWQPQLVAGVKPLTPQEQRIHEQHEWLPEPVRVLTRDTYAAAAALARREPGIVDLSDAFDTVAERVYLDPCHLNEAGNRRVAQLMLERGLLRSVQALVAARAAAPSGVPVAASR